MKIALSVEEFLEGWEELTTPEELRLFLEQHIPYITDDNIQRMKNRAFYLTSSNVNHALILTESLSYAAQLSGQPLHLVWALIAQGNLACTHGHYSQAIALYDEAHQRAHVTKNELEMARSYIGKVWALLESGEYQEAIQVGEAIRPVLAANDEFWALGNLDINLGNCYLTIGEFEQAIQIYQRGMEAFTTLNTPAGDSQAAMLKRNCSVILCHQDRYQEALQLATEAAETQRALGNKVYLAWCQQSIAYYNLRLGHFNLALRLLDEPREIFTANNMQTALTNNDQCSALCYLALNQFDRVVEYCELALNRLKAEHSNDKFTLGYLNYIMGIALAQRGRHEAALAAFEQARQFYFNLNNKMRLAELALAQAEFHYYQNEYQTSEHYCSEAETFFRELGLAANAARCDLLLGHIRLSQESFGEADQLAGQALAAGQETQTPLVIYQALLLQAEVAEKKGNLVEALELYRASLNVVEAMRGRIAAEARATFVEDKEVAYQGAVALSLALENWPEALELVERGKSRGLVELLAGDLDVRIRVRDEADRPLIEELEGWRARRNELISRQSAPSDHVLLNIRSAAVEVAPDLTSQQLMVEVRECERQIKQLVERLQVRNAAYAEDILLQPSEVKIETACLEEDTALLEYYICRDEVLAFVVDRNQVKVVRNLSTAKEVNTTLSFLRLNLAGVTHTLAEPLSPQQKSERFKQSNMNARALLNKLYHKLILPIADYLSGYEKLIIVPHGPLHYLPFHALYNGAKGRYLLEEWQEISYLPSGSLLNFCHKRGNRSQDERGHGSLVMGFSNGGNLTYCLDEAQAISNLLCSGETSGACSLYLEEEAQERRFKAEAEPKALIHLATHGQFRQDDPLFSGLLLADGEITAQDLFNQTLKASLITFSACETGLGALSGGDELQGLSRACLYAGASSLLLSLWRVEDESVSRLMQTFYTRLLQGAPKGTALREAQQSLLQNELYSHPFFWAAFILIGHAGSL